MEKKVIFDKKNVVVFGGAGFIGSHLCDELIKNSKVICVDNFITSRQRNIDHLLAEDDFVFINHDINTPLDLESLAELKKFKIEFQGIQEVYNLACPMSPKKFLDNRLNTLKTNSVGVLNVLDLAANYQAKLLHFSSSVIYGLRHDLEEGLKVKEDDLGKVNNLSLRSAYDEGKRFAETAVINYRDVVNLEAKIIRLFRVYGPRMELGDDQMIPDFIDNALDNKDLVVLGDENFSSAFCYIDDVIDAALKVMKSDIKSPVNIGSDLQVNITDIALEVIKQTNSNSKIKYADKNLFMTELAIPDISLARNNLAWMPMVNLKQGLKKTIFSLQADKGLHKFN
jgi:UDP-glucuronate decarboxylase